MADRDTVKFLIVDDLEENLVALEALLPRDGLEIIRAGSGAEALELLLVHDISLALLDVQMPGMDGFELAEVMRGPERTRSIPIIFLTALPADEARRFRGYEAGAVDYLQKPIDPIVLHNKTAVFFELARQRNSLRAQTAKLNQALELIQAHTDNSPMAFIQLDCQFRVTSWSKGAERMLGWAAQGAMGRTFAELEVFRPRDAEQFASLAATLVEDGASGRGVCELVARDRKGTLFTGEWYLSALYDAQGRLSSMSVQVLDVTGRKRAEETQRLLIGELNHRVKNTLATVQAMAAHTLRFTGDPASFAQTFGGRIQSMSRAHSMLSAATWRGAKLHEIVEDQLRLGLIDEDRFTHGGPAVYLKPQEALHIAMIVHELTTNAIKYGAYSVAEGRARLDWQFKDGMLYLRWVEEGKKGIEATAPKGFGTTLIEQSARAGGGSAHMSITANGIEWHIKLSIEDVPDGADGQSPLTSASESDRIAAMGDVLPCQKPSRALIIEDEPLVALDIATLLEADGFEIAGIAASIDEALTIIKHADIDVALLDGNLRGQAVDAVASALQERKISFVFVSGYGRENLPARFKGVPVVAKPFSDQQLVDATRSAMAAAMAT
ncbi:response regulator [Ensifer sp. HO-A22]|uniref:Blue-light-activated histidine kinase n=1 Tax=Ensifer oleiphilus TaxID=2742698 RepID=A0A7Y6Q6I5_9HYPH|nr:response regulator [Ensifer oleiphilus]NVD39972.1 response regulator [Ensifer oleiphilus]